MNGTPNENLGYGVALRPTTVVAGAGAVNSADTMLNLPNLGKFLTIGLLLPTQTGVTGFNVDLQGSNDGGSTWTSVKMADGTTTVGFTGTKYIAAGSYVNKLAVGSIDLSRAVYKDYRLGNITCTGANSTIQAFYVVSPVRNHQSAVAGVNFVDEWINSFLPSGS